MTTRIFRFLTVMLLSLSLCLLGPISALASPSPGTDPAMTFAATDMTAGFNASVGSSVAEITAISKGVTDGRTLIAGVDTDGRVVLAAWDTSAFTNWTTLWRSNIENSGAWTRINSIVFFNGDYIVAGSRTVGGNQQAVVAYLCGVCYPVFGHQGVFADANLAGHAAVTDMVYDASNLNLGLTVSEPSGFMVWRDARMYLNVFEPVTDAPMSSATSPIALYGNSADFGPFSDDEPVIMPDMSAEVLHAMPSSPYWTTGTTSGSVLAMGTSAATGIGPQTLTTPGSGQVLSLDYAWDDSAWLVGVVGDAGVMRLFKDTHTPALTITTGVTAATTDLNFPGTITTNADGEFVGPYYLVGGTGFGAAHLYKWKQLSGEFIDLDYLISDMSSVKVVAPEQAGGFFQPANLGTFNFFIGGTGSAKLLRLTETPVLGATPTPSGTADDFQCGDGSASVLVPNGAINQDYNILVEKVASGTPGAPGGLSLLGNSYEFECFDASGNPITTFDQPVTIVISYDPAKLNGMSEDSLVIYYYDTTDSTWKAVVPSVVDKVKHTVTITVSHFTQFGVLGASSQTLLNTGL